MEPDPVLAPEAGHLVDLGGLGGLGVHEAPDDAAIAALCERYALTLDRTWLPDIEARFGPMRLV